MRLILETFKTIESCLVKMVYGLCLVKMVGGLTSRSFVGLVLRPPVEDKA